MSRRNGDRARFQKNRKRQIHLRTRIRELVKRTREAGAAAAPASAAKSA
jgi:hypothetical protein